MELFISKLLYYCLKNNLNCCRWYLWLMPVEAWHWTGCRMQKVQHLSFWQKVIQAGIRFVIFNIHCLFLYNLTVNKNEALYYVRDYICPSTIWVSYKNYQTELEKINFSSFKYGIYTHLRRTVTLSPENSSSL